MLDPQDFDAAKPLILSRDALVNGHDMQQAEHVRVVGEESTERGELTAEQAARLWSNGAVIYEGRALATPVESPDQYARRTTEVDDLGDGKHLIRAPWLAAGEVVSSDELPGRLEEIITTGADGHRELINDLGPSAAAAVVTRADGFDVADKGNGNFEISGPGIEQPIKVRGRQNAEDKLAELRMTAASQRESPAAAGPAATAEVIPPVGQQGGLPVTDALTGVSAGSDNGGSAATSTE